MINRDLGMASAITEDFKGSKGDLHCISFRKKDSKTFSSMLFFSSSSTFSLVILSTSSFKAAEYHFSSFSEAFNSLSSCCRYKMSCVLSSSSLSWLDNRETSDSFLGAGGSSSKDKNEPCFSLQIFVESAGKLWDKGATDFSTLRDEKEYVKAVNG